LRAFDFAASANCLEFGLSPGSEIVARVLDDLHGEFCAKGASASGGDFDKDFFVTFFLGKKVRAE
jgi:hypothetical protein